MLKKHELVIFRKCNNLKLRYFVVMYMCDRILYFFTNKNKLMKFTILFEKWLLNKIVCIIHISLISCLIILILILFQTRVYQ